MSTPRVLIVDDEGPVAELLSYIVADAGYAPVVAPHGRDALEAARREWPDLLLTDLMMPYLDGAGLIAALRDEAVERGVSPIPSVLVTGAGPTALARAAADVVLRKPFEVADVEAVLRLLLGTTAAAARADD